MEMETGTNKAEAKVKVAYALPAKKVDSLIQPSLVSHARQRGVELVELDPGRPLAEQGPFDCLIHKVYGGDWKRRLEELLLQAEVVVVDMPEAIERLHNRVTMLDAVASVGGRWEGDGGACTVGVPRQAVVLRDADQDLQEVLAASGVGLPAVAKAVEANGTARSHEMGLVVSPRGLAELKPPMVVQEFVNHGGVVFKVYVAGSHFKCVRRPSLPDFDCERSDSEPQGILPFSHISNQPNNSSSNAGAGAGADETDMPPPGFIRHLATGLRESLRLNLFNFDLIRAAKHHDNTDGTPNSYLVIDINYFPGYAKVPGFEPMLTDFFLDLHTLGLP